jgi:hypothetical protein
MRIMITCRLACLLIPLVAVSCHCASSPTVKPSPSNEKSGSQKGTITVTIDGREATPEEAEAFGTFGKQLLSDAVAKAANKWWQELRQKLDINDPIETELLAEWLRSDPSGGDVLSAVYVIRPAKETKVPRTIVLLRDGKPIVRYTRARAPVEHPVAIITQTFTKDGHLTQSESFLVYGDGKWKQYRSSEHSESIK